MKREYMKVDSFIFYSSFYESIRELPKEQQAELYEAIFAYAFDGVETAFTGVQKAIFSLILPQLKANRSMYINGCRGGAPVGNQNARKQPNNNQDEGEENNRENNEDTTEKQPKNNQKTTVVDFGKTIKNDEKQPNENVNENENENYNYISPNAPTRVEETDFEKSYNDFMKNHTHIFADCCNSKLTEVDFVVLSEEIKRSNFLRQQTSLSWLVNQWEKIKSGYYRDFERHKKDNTFQILKDLHEEFSENET